jgi:hypothetical protein
VTVRRVVIGKRGDGTYGIFASKDGFDAFSTADANLLLNISTKVSSLILLTHVSSTQTISLGLSRSPVAIVTSLNSLNSLPGFPGGVPGPARPSPFLVLIPDGSGGFMFSRTPVASATINGNGASVTVNCSASTSLAVYSKPFT